MYGKNHSLENKERWSLDVKNKIKEGEWTPNIINSYTRKNFLWLDKKYRSSWEAGFHQLNPDCYYEDLKIDYYYQEKWRIYIVDFIDYKKRIVYEIKPTSKQKDYITKVKIKAAQKWCEENNFEFKLINENYFIENHNNLNLEEFDENTRKNLEKLWQKWKK